MSDSFTVRLDLSAITRNENERLYILLVDPARMKMIYQFKLWVRFLFSVENPITFLYEGAAIHDLEDVNILKLLKIVHIEHADHAVGEREQQEQLIAKLNRYDEWCRSSTPAVTPQNLRHLTNGDGFQSPSREYHGITETKTENNEQKLSIANEQYDRREKHERGQKNNHSDLQRYLNMKNETCDKSKTRNGSFIRSPRSLPSDEVEVSSEIHYSKYSNTPKCDGEAEKSCSKAGKQQSTAKRKSAHKPFSLYHFLHTLRCQESNDDDDKVKQDPATELDKNEVANINSNGEIFNSDEKVEEFVKRKRKRIRKHKNQRNKVNPPVETYKDTLVPLFHYKEKFKSKSLSPQAKHIRFDTDEDNGESANKPEEDALPVVNGNSNEGHLNSGSELTNDNRFGGATSVDCVNKSDTAVATTVDVSTTPQENGSCQFEAKNVSVADCVEVNNGSLSDSSGNVSDILGSHRKKSNTPFVFDRFAACV